MNDGTESKPIVPRSVGLLLGIISALVVWWLVADPRAGAAGAVMTLMACWWLTEALPLAATSLVPLVLFPALGVLSTRDAAAPYADRVIFLFMGGFMLAAAMQRCGLHTRIALRTVRIIGLSPARIVAGFMVATAILSMWVSNTATAMMMLPIATSIIAVFHERDEQLAKPLGTCLMLGIAYAATIGGVATPIGTPPNAFLMAHLAATFDKKISFLDWMGVGLPVTIVFLPITWLLLTRFLFPIGSAATADARRTIDDRLGALGPMKRAEWIVFAVFCCTVTLWVGRGLLEDLVFSEFSTKGDPDRTRFWAWLICHDIDDASIAIAAALALFIAPAAPGRAVLEWKDARHIPWGVLLLFGGGLSLAKGAEVSGVSRLIGDQAHFLAGLPLPVTVVIIAAALIALSELTSNTATANIFYPILSAAAVVGLGVDPLLLLVPACLGVSLAFMMPVGTPPNAIAYSTGLVSMRQMIRAGFFLNLISIVLCSLATYTVAIWALGLQTSGLPDWASP
ncbi:MAG: anion permease [Phycisphaeraceae bacterium]|nr:anion permease [Phycisphaeraceae bacterium]